jgi:oligopeptide/dipeptide ABC transporter ATP-binding protein
LPSHSHDSAEPTPARAAGELLRIEDLRVEIGEGERRVRAVRGASLVIPERGRVGVVGESGSGKSMTAAAIIALLPPGTRVTGSVRFAGRELLALGEDELRRVRGEDVGMVFQNAKAALNPLFSIGEQIADVYRLHEGVEPEVAWAKAVEMLDAMGIPNPSQRAAAFPHQLSGGMAQRAMIAMALVCSPRLLIADEPTTGLDATIEAQVLELISRTMEDSHSALMLISHDLGVIASTCEHVVVMYAGEVFEAGSRAQVFGRPANPYTALLIECYELADDETAAFIPGSVPDLRADIERCAFADRCPMAIDVCRARKPELRALPDGRLVTCHRAEEVLEHGLHAHTDRVGRDDPARELQVDDGD